MTNHQCYWHNIGSGTQGSKWRELMAPQKPKKGIIKRNEANNKNHLVIVNQSEKIL